MYIYYTFQHNKYYDPFKTNNKRVTSFNNINNKATVKITNFDHLAALNYMYVFKML